MVKRYFADFFVGGLVWTVVGTTFLLAWTGIGPLLVFLPMFIPAEMRAGGDWNEYGRLWGFALVCLGLPFFVAGGLHRIILRTQESSSDFLKQAIIHGGVSGFIAFIMMALLIPLIHSHFGTPPAPNLIGIPDMTRYVQFLLTDGILSLIFTVLIGIFCGLVQGYQFLLGQTPDDPYGTAVPKRVVRLVWLGGVTGCILGSIFYLVLLQLFFERTSLFDPEIRREGGYKYVIGMRNVKECVVALTAVLPVCFVAGSSQMILFHLLDKKGYSKLAFLMNGMIAGLLLGGVLAFSGWAVFYGFVLPFDFFDYGIAHYVWHEGPSYTWSGLTDFALPRQPWAGLACFLFGLANMWIYVVLKRKRAPLSE